MKYEKKRIRPVYMIAKRKNEKKSETYPMCFPPPALLFHEPSIDCITINATESGSTHDAPLKATAN